MITPGDMGRQYDVVKPVKRIVWKRRFAFKDVQIYPHRSNDVTIWGTPIGQGSVDFDAIIPLLSENLPAPDDTTVCIKLRLPPDNHEHEMWMVQSLDYLKNHPTLAEQL